MSSQQKRPQAKAGTAVRLIKTLFSFYPVLLPAVVVCLLVAAMSSSFGSVFLQGALQIVTEFGESGNWAAAQPEVFRLVATLAAVYLVGVCASLFWNRAMAIITQGSLEKLREKLFNHMQDLPISYFDTHQRGDVMSHYTNDIDAIRQMISQSLPNLFQTCVVLVTVFIIMLYFSVWMCLVIVAGVAFMVFMTKVLGGNSARFFVAQQRELGVVEGQVEEIMNGQKVVKAFCHEQAAERDFDAFNEHLFEVSQKANMYGNILMPVLMNIGNLHLRRRGARGRTPARPRHAKRVAVRHGAVHRRGGAVPQHDQAVLRPDWPDLHADQRRGHGPCRRRPHLCAHRRGPRGRRGLRHAREPWRGKRRAR